MFENKKDCLLTSVLNYKYLHVLRDKFSDSDYKYISIYKDIWGEGDQDFHMFVKFKYNGTWWYLDNVICAKWDCAKNMYKKAKKIKVEDVDNWDKIDMIMYCIGCGYKNFDHACNQIQHRTNFLLLRTDKNLPSNYNS
jgi:hypothetical protein